MKLKLKGGRREAGGREKCCRLMQIKNEIYFGDKKCAEYNMFASFAGIKLPRELFNKDCTFRATSFYENVGKYFATTFGF